MVRPDRTAMHRAGACRAPECRRPALEGFFFSASSTNAGVSGQVSLGPRIMTAKRVRRPDMRRWNQPSMFGDSGMTSDPWGCVNDYQRRSASISNEPGVIP